MEGISLHPNNPEKFDSLVHCGAMERGDLSIASKAGATVDGAAGVVISFTAMVDGAPVLVQATTTLKLFNMAAKAMCAAHGEPS